MNTKICTSIKQSKKLIKLEVDVNTTDMTYVSMKDYDENTYHLTVGKTDVDWAKDELGNLNWNDVYEKYVPAWSLSALVDLMPKNVEIERTHIGWRCDYYSNDDSLLKYGKDKNTLFDAVFEMVVWLLENKMI